MKFSLIILAFGFALSASAQDEVEFVVQKKQEVKPLLYMYTDKASNRMKKGSEYINISQVADTFYYYYAAINRDTSKLPVPYLAVNYSTSNDTVYAHMRYGNISESQPLFIKGKKMIDLPVSVKSFFNASLINPIVIQNSEKAFVLDSNISVTVGDTSYQCIRIAAGTEAFYENGERLSKNPRKKLYFVHIYYLRKTDYLPIKIAWVEGDREFSTKSTFGDDVPYWELYKVLK